jgi:hypothetical protein
MIAYQEQAPKKRVKVAIVAPSLRYVGGQAVQADLLMRLWQGDPEIDVTFISVDPPFPASLAWAEKIPFLRTLLREPLYFLLLWRGLKAVDIAHIFSASYWSFLLAPAPAWLVAKLRGKKTLINYRSGEARDHLQRFRSGTFVLSRTDANVAPSGYSPYYCIDVVVRAFAEVQKIYPEARLDLVGGGKLEAEIRQLVSDLKLANVMFTGVASRHEIGKHYADADIFINASRVDNMPVSIIEAFAAGTPVVTTSPESIPYFVEHERTGLLSPVGDAKALAANVLRLLRDPELASRLAQNAHLESRKYTWEAVRGQWVAVYKQLLT